jgi:hypothetical protein
MTPFDLLDNIMWHTLSDPHPRYSVGTNEARRYIPGFSAVLVFEDTIHPLRFYQAIHSKEHCPATR